MPDSTQEELIVVPDDILPQPGDSMFIRNVGHMAARGREARLWIINHPNPVIGFFAGLDDKYIQVCKTNDSSLTNIEKTFIVMIEETGNTLWEYEKIGTLSLDGKPVDVRLLREKTYYFRKKASKVFPNRR